MNLVSQQAFKLLDQVIQRVTPRQAFFENFVAVLDDPAFEGVLVVLLVAGAKDADMLRAMGVFKVVTHG